MTVAVVVAVALPAVPAHAAPTFAGALAGRSVAATYPSGIEYDDVNDRLVVADTGLDRVGFYRYSIGATPDASTYELLGTFGSHGTGEGRFDTPRDVAIDGTGAIYVADAGNNRVQKFTSDGAFRWEISYPFNDTRSLNTPIGVTWDAATDLLLVASTGQDSIKAYRADGSLAWYSPPGVRTNGLQANEIDIDAPRDVTRGPDGRIWIADYHHHRVAVFDVVPPASDGGMATFADGDAGTAGIQPAFTLGMRGSGDGNLNFPYNIDFSLDGSIAYVSDTGNNRVARWRIDGAAPQWLDPIGGKCPQAPDPCLDPPADLGYIDTLRRVIVDPDGLVVTADFWGNGMQVWHPDGTPAAQIELEAADAPGFAQAFGVAVGPAGEVYAMDRLNQRLQYFDETGTYMRTGGSRGTAQGRFSWPEAVAVDPSSGVVWAADTRGDRIQRWPAGLTSRSTFSRGTSGTGTGEFNYIEDLDVAPDGVVFVADTRNDRIQVYDPSADPAPQTNAGSSGLSVFPAAPTNGSLNDPQGVVVSATSVFVADTSNDRILRFSRATGAQQAVSAAGLNAPQGLGLAPDGTLWVADSGNHRIVHLSADLVDLGHTFGLRGAGDLAFEFPHTVAVHGTTLYVADTFNDRVQIVDVSSLGGGGTEVDPPDATVTSPTDRQSVDSVPVPMLGDATDDAGVASVEVAIQDRDTKQWARANGSWGGYQKHATTLSEPGGTSTSWSFAWTPPAGGTGRYGMSVIATDTAGKIDPTKPWVRFDVDTSGGGGSDTSPPSAPTITSPTGGQAFTSVPVPFRGSAADDVGVGRVEVAIKDRTQGLWLQTDDSWDTRYRKRDADLASPGASSSAWSYDWTPPASGSSSYAVQVVVTDTSGNVATTKPTRRFTVDDDGGGTEADPPDATVTSPTDRQSVGSVPVPMLGDATDDAGVASVEVAIQDRDTKQWARANGSWGGYQKHATSLSNPGGTSTSWSFTWTPPAGGSGRYGMSVIATDTAGKIDPTKPWVRFDVDTSGGGGSDSYVPDFRISDPGGVAPLYPAGGATASTGVRYVADSGGSRIVQISSTGNQSVLSSGSTWNDPRDVDIDVSDPSVLWVANTSASQIVKLGTNGTVQATFAADGAIDQPYGLANDATGVYVANTYATPTAGVMKISRSTGDVLWNNTQGCGGTAFGRPRDVAVGSDGNVYVADTDRNRIVSLDPTTGACLGSFGSGGTADGQFRAPRALVSDGAGGLWVAEGTGNRLQHVTNTGAFLGKIGTFGEGDGQFRSAHCVFMDGAFVAVCDTFNYRIQRFSVNASGVPSFHSILGGTRPTDGGFNGAFDVAYGPDGSMYVADWFNHRIQKFTAAGAHVASWGGYGTPNGSLIFPRGIVVRSDGTVVVTDSENNRIDLLQSNGTFIRRIRPTGDAFRRPHQTAVTTDGKYWVADTGTDRLVLVADNGDGTGTIERTITANITAPRGIAADANGNVYASTGGTVRKIAPNGTQTILAANGTGNTQVRNPHGLRIVGSGSSAQLLIADRNNHRVLVLTLDGTYVTQLGSAGSGDGQFDFPQGVDRHPTTGQLAVADFGNDRVSVWQPG